MAEQKTTAATEEYQIPHDEFVRIWVTAHSEKKGFLHVFEKVNELAGEYVPAEVIIEHAQQFRDLGISLPFFRI